jgi:hypothetical protein
MEKIKITQNRRTSFTCEISLSDAQIKMLCEIFIGDDNPKYLQDYRNIKTTDFFPEDASQGGGLGAEINDILSLGFLLCNYLHDSKTKVTLNDLSFDPLRIKIPKIKSVDFEYVDCSIHKPDYKTMDKEDVFVIRGFRKNDW